MNPNLQFLNPYPFEKLANLKQGCIPPSHLAPINLSIGEPQHPTPALIVNSMNAAIATGLGKYPSTKGKENLRSSIAQWLTHRFELPTIDPNCNILPVNGTREALFAFAQCMVNSQARQPLVLIPNPFYQIYEGATFLAGAKPWFINSTEQTNWQPDFTLVPVEVWTHCQLLYLCSPSNPCGTTLNLATLQKLIEFADRYNFSIAADECYAEIYADETCPPVGLLQACTAAGRLDYRHCVVFHSLSKRSNAPGLRSGFVAGDAKIIQQFFQYRTYHGCAMSEAVQIASIAAWEDENHVIENRALYRQKYAVVMEILAPVINYPPAGFYLWLKTPIPDVQFTRELFNQQNITVLPGSFLSRTAHGINPGQNHVRIALVASLQECTEAATRIRTFMEGM